MLYFSANDSAARALIGKIRELAGDGAFDQPVEIAANRVWKGLVEATPKRWTGLTRQAWSVTKTGDGERLVSNSSKIMQFLEKGTGLDTGGWIYPKSKMLLYIPLTATASYGWQPGMQFGVDYVLAKRVRGIKAMKIVELYRPVAMAILKEEMKSFLRKALT